MGNLDNESAEGAIVWLLVDHSTRADAFSSVAGALEERGVRAQVVTITEVIGSMARTALAGSAERVLRGLRVAVQGRSDEDLIGAVRRDRPDILIITNPSHVRALSVLEGITGIPSLLLGVLPDYNLNETWIKTGLQAYIVGHEELRGRLVHARVPEERVLVAGPAVQPGFARELDKAALRSEFGFSQSEKIVIVRVESFDVDTIEKLVFQAKLVENARVIFHHNGDSTAANTLRRATGDYGFRAVMFGRVSELERYMAIADAVVTSGADPLMPELLALGLPVMLVGQARGYEEQAEFLQTHDLGRFVPEIVRLGAELERFVGPESLEKHQAAAQSIGLPGGSIEVADAIVEVIQRAKAWEEQEPEAPANDGDGAGQGEDDRREQFSGGFESIGGSRAARGGGSSTPERDARGDRGGDVNPYEGISRAEAKQQLAQLILSERELERKLGELEKEQQRWRGRLDHARQLRYDDLATEAESILREYLREAEPLQQELEDVRKQKSKLKAAANPKAARSGRAADPAVSSRMAELERRFSKMEEDRELDDLKGRIDRELGD